MDALFSRCQIFEFSNTISKEYVIQYISNIIKNELNETGKEDVIKQYVNKYFPDIRKTLNAIQSKVINGTLIDDIVNITKNETDILEKVKEIFYNIKSNNMNMIPNQIKVIEKMMNESEIDYINLYNTLFNDDGISFTSKVIVNKYCSKHMESIIPQMNFLSMIFELIELGIKKVKAIS